MSLIALELLTSFIISNKYMFEDILEKHKGIKYMPHKCYEYIDSSLSKDEFILRHQIYTQSMVLYNLFVDILDYSKTHQRTLQSNTESMHSSEFIHLMNLIRRVHRDLISSLQNWYVLYVQDIGSAEVPLPCQIGIINICAIQKDMLTMVKESLYGNFSVESLHQDWKFQPLEKIYRVEENLILDEDIPVYIQCYFEANALDFKRFYALGISEYLGNVRKRTLESICDLLVENPNIEYKVFLPLGIRGEYFIRFIEILINEHGGVHNRDFFFHQIYLHLPELIKILHKDISVEDLLDEFFCTLDIDQILKSTTLMKNLSQKEFFRQKNEILKNSSSLFQSFSRALGL